MSPTVQRESMLGRALWIIAVLLMLSSGLYIAISGGTLIGNLPWWSDSSGNFRFLLLNAALGAAIGGVVGILGGIVGGRIAKHPDAGKAAILIGGISGLVAWASLMISTDVGWAGPGLYSVRDGYLVIRASSLFGGFVFNLGVAVLCPVFVAGFIAAITSPEPSEG